MSPIANAEQTRSLHLAVPILAGRTGVLSPFSERRASGRFVNMVASTERNSVPIREDLEKILAEISHEARPFNRRGSSPSETEAKPSHQLFECEFAQMTGCAKRYSTAHSRRQVRREALKLSRVTVCRGRVLCRTVQP